MKILKTDSIPVETVSSKDEAGGVHYCCFP